MARVKEKTRPWKESIALVLAIGAAVVSRNAHGIFNGVAQHSFSQLPTVLSYVFAAVFGVLAIIAMISAFGVGMFGTARAQLGLMLFLPVPMLALLAVGLTVHVRVISLALLAVVAAILVGVIVMTSK